MVHADTYKGHKGDTRFVSTITREGIKHVADNGDLLISIAPMIGTKKGTADYKRRYYSAAFSSNGYVVEIADGSTPKRAAINAAKQVMATTPAIPDMKIKRFVADLVGWMNRVEERMQLSYIVIDY